MNEVMEVSEINILDEAELILSESILLNRKLSRGIDESILKSITDFDEYINYLATITKSYTIFISSKDTPGDHLSNELEILGLINLSKNFQLSYVAVLKKGEILFEQLSNDRLEKKDFVKYDTLINGTSISITSKGYIIGNVSEVIIAGKNHSQNRRGLNFVIYCEENEKVIDSVGFDLHVPKKECYRVAKVIDLCTEIDRLKNLIVKNNTLSTAINRTQQDIFFKSISKNKYSIIDAKKDFFLSLPRSEKLRDVQNGELFILRVIDSICRKNGLSYWLIGGTLIGAIRHNGPVPWDDDIDICMIREDFLRFCDIMDKQGGYAGININRYCWTSEGQYKGFFYRVEIGEACLNNKRVFVDIFPCCYVDVIEETRDEMRRFIEFRRAFLRDKMGVHKYRWDKIVNDRKAFNQQWRSDLQEINKKFDAQFCRSDNPRGLIFSLTNNLGTAMWRFNVDDIFPLIDYEYDGFKFMTPNNPWNFLCSYYEDIYYIPNDILTHSHLKDVNGLWVKEKKEEIETIKKQIDWE